MLGNLENLIPKLEKSLGRRAAVRFFRGVLLASAREKRATFFSYDLWTQKKFQSTLKLLKNALESNEMEGGGHTPYGVVVHLWVKA